MPDLLNEQHHYWNRAFAGAAFYYGHEPGPVARRAVRYNSLRGRALDVGCGEGQDLAFLAECGFETMGLDFTATGIEKSRRILQSRNLAAETLHADLTQFDFALLRGQFAVVLCVNVLQFVGEHAPRMLDEIVDCVAPGGVLGFSTFAPGELNSGRDELWLCSEDDLVARLRPHFHMLETASLRQWKGDAAQPFATVVARRKA